MKIRATILISMGLVLTAVSDMPEVDNTYFHPAASLYIHGDTTAASNLVARGLAEYPDDGKLKRLKELLEQQDQQQQNEDQQQKQDQQQNEDEQDQDQQEQEDSQDPPQDDQQDQESQDNQDQDQADQQNQQQPEPQRADQMSRDEAERLLDAMKQEEKNKRLDLHPVLGRPVKVDKDW